ncbi:hypothetical protein EA472_06510 [Natrarchaeobius oligotrophus]|uniref:Uncharacterized protein n=1 Tax=Natrarchaeobius chitinivorans TaxID=1679083 RepID=A0A3N6MVG2_NATCH|nr:hypothetical protein EA472_06510 [Natrarchaeobius chitinivorans]
MNKEKKIQDTHHRMIRKLTGSLIQQMNMEVEFVQRIESHPDQTSLHMVTRIAFAAMFKITRHSNTIFRTN